MMDSWLHPCRLFRLVATQAALVPFLFVSVPAAALSPLPAEPDLPPPPRGSIAQPSRMAPAPAPQHRGGAVAATSLQVYGGDPASHLLFTRLSVADGLSHSDVRAIVQDRQGFMWFGT